MAKAAMKHSKTTFVFTPELGARLRLLRLHRGLSLREMAALMDRNRPGSYNPLALLERGEVKHPSFNLIVDYLRACGAGFADLLDLLNPHTSRPPVLREKGDKAVAELLKSLPRVERQAMLRWERATTAAQEAKAAAAPGRKKPRVQADHERVFRIIWSFIHANWSELFEQQLYEKMRTVRDDVPRSERREACRYGRKLFGILTRYYRYEERRRRALARVELAARHDGFSPRVVAALRGAAESAYRELQRTGRLDWEPTSDDIIKNRGHAPKVEKAETRLELEETEPVRAHNKALALVQAMVMQVVAARLEELRVQFYHGQEYYFRWIQELMPIACECGTDSAEWKAKIEEWVPKLHDPGVAEEMAKLIADTYSRWKSALPSKPT